MYLTSTYIFQLSETCVFNRFLLPWKRVTFKLINLLVHLRIIRAAEKKWRQLNSKVERDWNQKKTLLFYFENNKNTSVTTLAILDAPLATISKNKLPAFGLKTTMYLELTLGRQLKKLELRKKVQTNKFYLPKYSDCTFPKLQTKLL